MNRLVAMFMIGAVLFALFVQMQATGAQLSCDDYDAVPGDGITFRGGSDNDVLLGTDGDDIFRGGSGNDLLCGFGGNDLLVGGTGNDILVGGEGEDELRGGTGNDTFLVDGYDTVRTGSGADKRVQDLPPTTEPTATDVPQSISITYELGDSEPGGTVTSVCDFNYTVNNGDPNGTVWIRFTRESGGVVTLFGITLDGNGHTTRSIENRVMAGHKVVLAEVLSADGSTVLARDEHDEVCNL